MARRLLGDDAADLGGAGEVDPAHRRMRDDRLDDAVGVLRGAGEEVEHAGGQARLVQDLGDDRVGARAGLRRAEDDGVAAHDGVGDGAGRQDAGAVPRRHAEHDAGGLAHGHRQRAGLVGRDGLALDLRGEAGGLAEELRGEEDVEAGPELRGAHLGHHRLDELRGTALHDVGGLQHDGATLAGTRRPRRERLGRRLHRVDGVVDAGCRALGDEVAGQRVQALERLAALGVPAQLSMISCVCM